MTTTATSTEKMPQDQLRHYKSLFLMQYYYQDILFKDDKATDKCRNLEPSSLSQLRECYLELKPLHLISDKHLQEVYKMVHTWNDVIADMPHVQAQLGKETVSAILCNEPTSIDVHTIISICDYLRSKGYALPFMQFSIDDQVQLGWVKLKENL